MGAKYYTYLGADAFICGENGMDIVSFWKVNHKHNMKNDIFVI